MSCKPLNLITYFSCQDESRLLRMEDIHTGEATAATMVTAPEWARPGKIPFSATVGEDGERVRVITPRRMVIVLISVDKQKHL